MKHFLSICAVVRDEAPYLAEWIEFHKLQGVEHFYLYENESKDETADVIDLYVLAGVATHIPWPGTKIQLPAYQHCLDTYGEDNKWIAFLDCDEFLYAKHLSLPNFLADPLFSEPAIGGVAARWRLFGSNGLVDQTDDLVINRFVSRARYPDKHVKSIVRPSSGAFTGKNPHSFRFPQGRYAVDEHGNKLSEEYGIMLGQTADRISINHYHTKSRAEYMKRKKNPDPGSGVIHSSRRLEEMFAAHDLNDIEDTYIRDKFAAQIKDKLK